VALVGETAVLLLLLLRLLLLLLLLLLAAGLSRLLKVLGCVQQSREAVLHAAGHPAASPCGCNLEQAALTRRYCCT
jgi:hypothetical protein